MSVARYATAVVGRELGRGLLELRRGPRREHDVAAVAQHELRHFATRDRDPPRSPPPSCRRGSSRLPRAAAQALCVCRHSRNTARPVIARARSAPATGTRRRPGPTSSTIGISAKEHRAHGESSRATTRRAPTPPRRRVWTRRRGCGTASDRRTCHDEQPTVRHPREPRARGRRPPGRTGRHVVRVRSWPGRRAPSRTAHGAAGRAACTSPPGVARARPGARTHRRRRRAGSAPRARRAGTSRAPARGPPGRAPRHVDDEELGVHLDRRLAAHQHREVVVGVLADRVGMLVVRRGRSDAYAASARRRRRGCRGRPSCVPRDRATCRRAGSAIPSAARPGCPRPRSAAGSRRRRRATSWLGRGCGRRPGGSRLGHRPPRRCGLLQHRGQRRRHDAAAVPERDAHRREEPVRRGEFEERAPGPAASAGLPRVRRRTAVTAGPAPEDGVSHPAMLGELAIDRDPTASRPCRSTSPCSAGSTSADRNRIPMADLRALYERHGHDDVTTYVQSGNVVSRTTTRSARTVETDIERAIADDLGLDVTVLVRTPARARRVRSTPTRSCATARTRSRSTSPSSPPRPRSTPSARSTATPSRPTSSACTGTRSTCRAPTATAAPRSTTRGSSGSSGSPRPPATGRR